MRMNTAVREAVPLDPAGKPSSAGPIDQNAFDENLMKIQSGPRTAASFGANVNANFETENGSASSSADAIGMTRYSAHYDERETGESYAIIEMNPLFGQPYV
jgi:hypothetical protein